MIPNSKPRTIDFENLKSLNLENVGIVTVENCIIGVDKNSKKVHTLCTIKGKYSKIKFKKCTFKNCLSNCVCISETKDVLFEECSFENGAHGIA